MSGRNLAVFHIASVHAGWFACVMGAAAGFPFLGAFVVGGLLLSSLWIGSESLSRAKAMAVVTLVGVAVDSCQMLAGLIVFDQTGGDPWAEPIAGLIVPVWMIALWLNFSIVLRPLLSFFRQRLLLAALLGGIGGVVAYRGGAELGALSLAGGTYALLSIGLAWSALFPFAVYVDARMATRADGSLQGDRAGEEFVSC